MPKTIGEIIFPRSSPNLIQIFLRGVKILEFKIPNIKKINAILTDHNLKSPPLEIGHIEIIKKNNKKKYSKAFIAISSLHTFIFHMLTLLI